jgi:hypothetical protein
VEKKIGEGEKVSRVFSWTFRDLSRGNRRPAGGKRRKKDWTEGGKRRVKSFPALGFDLRRPGDGDTQNEGDA